jgi:PHD/YefM family antitoxin component YafN of YafNO toxin-antitoxin module
MSENPSEDIVHTLREHGARYVIGTKGHPVAVLLTLKEYDHYLDLLDDEADSQDDELAARLAQAAARPTREERQTLRDYLRQREASRAEV